MSGEPTVSLALLVKICVTLGKVFPWLYALALHMHNEGFIHPTFKNCTDLLQGISQILGPEEDPDDQRADFNVLVF